MKVLTGVSGERLSNSSTTNHHVSVIAGSLAGDLGHGTDSASAVLRSHLALVGVRDTVGAADWSEDSLTKLAFSGGFDLHS